MAVTQNYIIGLHTENLFYSDFSNDSIDSVPNAWTTQESNETPGNGPVVKENSTVGRSDKIFALVGNRDAFGDVADAPGGSGYYRWAQMSQKLYSVPIIVSYKFQAGADAGNLYGLTNSPEVDEDLWFQYNISPSSDWITAGHHVDTGDQYGNVFTEVSHVIDAGQSKDNPIKLRWISRTLGDTNHDHWGFTNVKIRVAQEGFRRQLAAGPFNLRGQTVDAFHKTFVGDQR
jgi:hypothetical protein